MACVFQALLFAVIEFAPVARACTYVESTFSSGLGKKTRIIGRTMELGRMDSIGITDWKFVVHKRGEVFNKLLHSDGAAVKHTGTYGYVSIDFSPPKLPIPIIGHWVGDLVGFSPSDGMNEEGLTVSANKFNGAVFQDQCILTPSRNNVWQWKFAQWVLSSFSNLAQLKTELENNTCVHNFWMPASFDGFHWAVAERSGRSAVIEYDNGVLKWYENKVGLLTNDPPFPWMLMNLNQYPFVSPNWPKNNQLIEIDTEDEEAGLDAGKVPDALVSSGNGHWGGNHGFNLGGLPGDLSPSSRFVRTFFLKRYAHLNAPWRSEEEAVAGIKGILNGAFITKGVLASPDTLFDGKAEMEYTPWTSVKVPKTLHFYYSSYENPWWRFVDLTRLNFTVDHAAVEVEVPGHKGYYDLTDEVNKPK